jgi:hypothetical protein
MNFNLFKIDTWWKAVFIIGLIACVGSALINIDFIQKKHLFGFGIGMLLIGLAYWMASKTANTMHMGGILSWPVIKHNFVSIILLIIGIGLTGLFGFLIVKGLI